LKLDIRIRELGFDLGRDARSRSARTTLGAGLASLLGWVDRVEPEHVGVMLGSRSVLCFT